MDKKLDGGFNALVDFEKRWAGAWIEGWKSYCEVVANLAGNPASLPRNAPAEYSKLVAAAARYYQTVLDSSVELAASLNPSAPERKPLQDDELAAEPVPPAKPRAEMLFEGPAGTVLTRQFLVANKNAGPLEVSFELSDFISEEGERDRLDVELFPESFTFFPGEERTVECRVPVSSSLIEGREYRAILRAIGMPDLQITLRVKRVSWSKVNTVS